MISVRDYLAKIEPRQVDNRGRLKLVAESRLKAFAAAREVLIAGVGSGDYVTAVAASVTAAKRHGADAGEVWRLVRKWRMLRHGDGEQLSLFPQPQSRPLPGPTTLKPVYSVRRHPSH